MKYLGRINFVLRLLLGGVFVVAGAIKIWNPADFATAIGNFRLMPHDGIHLLAIMLPWIELVAGLFLMIGFWKRSSAVLITFLMIVFMVAIGQAVSRNLNIDCGCFGTMEGRKVGVIALVQDTAMLATAIWLAYWYHDEAQGDLKS